MRCWLVVLALAACHARDDRRVHDAIIGSWEVQCAIRDGRTSSCPREDSRHIHQTFGADGGFESRRPDGDTPPVVGIWWADDDQVTLLVDYEGVRRESYFQARIDGDRLVLWNAKHHDGSILRRVRP